MSLNLYMSGQLGLEMRYTLSACSRPLPTMRSKLLCPLFGLLDGARRGRPETSIMPLEPGQAILEMSSDLAVTEVSEYRSATADDLYKVLLLHAYV